MMSSLIHLPCDGCGREIGFGIKRCVACGTRPSKEQKLVLHERLLAASPDYRRMRHRLLEVRAILFILGGIQIAISAFAFGVAPSAADPSTGALALVLLLTDVVFGCGLIAASFIVERFPRVIIPVVLFAWLFLHGTLALLWPLSVIEGALGKLVVVVLLLRGYVAAGQAATLRRQFAVQPLSG